MKRRDIERKLKDAGWIIIPGAKHDMAINPQRPGVKIPIPRHREIKEPTANEILKEAGVS